MVEGGPIDVLTGDYLAELTLMILLKDRLKDPQLGYARTFLRQLEEVAADLRRARHQDRGERRRPEPGRAAPRPRARVYERLGVRARVAHIEGDDLMPKLEELQAEGEPFDASRQGHAARLARRAGA